MKITKFPQSCILVETQGQKILVDPGKTKFDKAFLDYWKKATAILVTHRHSDHFYGDVLQQLSAPIYSTKEVQNSKPELKIHLVKANDTFSLGKVKIEVVKAVHGYMLPAGEIKENVGFIIDDGKTRLYITSDTIRFKHNYKADIMFADITAFDASMNLWGAVATFNEVGAKLLIVAHQDEGKMFYTKQQIEDFLKQQNVNYVLPEILDVVEV